MASLATSTGVIRAHAYAVENGLGFDYGTKSSIREKACGKAIPPLILGAIT